MIYNSACIQWEDLSSLHCPGHHHCYNLSYSSWHMSAIIESKLRDSMFLTQGLPLHVRTYDSCQKFFSQWGRTHCMGCSSCLLLADWPHQTFDHLDPCPLQLFLRLSVVPHSCWHFFKTDQPTLTIAAWPLKLICFIFSTFIDKKYIIVRFSIIIMNLSVGFF